MKKTDKNIIEAGITPTEFYQFFAGDFSMEDYLSEFPLQTHRYDHLADLAMQRKEYELAEYFRGLSGKPMIVDWCD